MRIGYLGPEGTFTHEALLAHLSRSKSVDEEPELVALPTIREVVLGVQRGEVEQALVPIENSVEGSVDVTLDTLALEAPKVQIDGELVHPISQCLIAREEIALPAIEVVLSHPQASAQCARFLRTRVGQAEVRVAASTAEAVRQIALGDPGWAALGNRAAAERYGCRVLAAGVEDEAGNETRFALLRLAGAAGPADAPGTPPAGDGAKTIIVFWGPGTDTPGWLVACLAELADRGVNLTRIESRPRREGFGRYMFFADLQGAASDAPVSEALRALAGHVEVLRVLGSFPVARP